jgi:hypothetical protein
VILRRAWSAAATLAVALAVALAVPVAQLRLDRIVIDCCCPDPSNCHCPDHKPDHSSQPAMRACHRTQHQLVSPQAPAFVAAQVAIEAPPLRVAPLAIAPPEAPHASPAVDDPYGPS